jgi:hypothetical protein
VAGIELPLALVALGPEPNELARWRIDPAASTAVVRVEGALLPTRPGVATADVLRRLVETQLIAYADLSEAADECVPVRYAWRRDWREALAEELGPLLPTAQIAVVIESASSVPLIAREPAATIMENGRDQ